MAATEAPDHSQHLAALGQQSYAPNGVVPVWLTIGDEPVATEEPGEGILHARVCGGAGGQPPVLPGTGRRYNAMITMEENE